MLSFFTIALIASFVLMTWFESPADPLVRHEPSPDNAGAVENESEAA